MTATAIAAFAVFPHAYRDDAHLAAVAAGTALPGPAIVGLRVTLPERRAVAHWHETTGLYGFTGAIDGPQLVHIEDPQRRFVPRTVTVDTNTRAAIAEAMRRQATEPPTSPKPTLLAVAMRPGHGHVWPHGETVFRGSVTEMLNGRRVPSPFARIEVRRSGSITHTLHTDETGRFALWLRGEITPLTGTNPPVSFRAQARRRRAPEPGPALHGHPGNFDTLSPAEITATYGPPMAPVSRAVVAGDNTTLTLDIP